MHPLEREHVWLEAHAEHATNVLDYKALVNELKQVLQP